MNISLLRVWRTPLVRELAMLFLAGVAFGIVRLFFGINSAERQILLDLFSIFMTLAGCLAIFIAFARKRHR